MQNLSLKRIGSFASEIGAEISTFDKDRNLLYVVSGDTDLQVLDLSDPTTPREITTLDLTQLGVSIAGANSVAYSHGLLAIALEAEEKTDPGAIAVINLKDGSLRKNFRRKAKVFTVGSLPDMVTFTPDGSKILVANEGEPDDEVDPDGSVSIIDVSGNFKKLSQKNVATADFQRFNGKEADLRADGVRIFPDANTAQDFEPEYISVSPDGKKAFVTLEENNAIAVVDIESATVDGIQPLGLKDFSKGLPNLTNYTFNNRGAITNNGCPVTTPYGQRIELGGFSGLYYDGKAKNGNLKFLAIPDASPNRSIGGHRQAFLLPNNQASVVSFELNEDTGEINITNQLLLKRKDGRPITNLPNIPNVDPQAVDARGHSVNLPSMGGFGTFGADYDPLGADFESILRAPDGTLWAVDEQRSSIYHFDQNGTLLNRLVPKGTAAQANKANPGKHFPIGTFGSETLPSDYLNRRANRGFEGAALDTETGIFYAFMQTPLDTPGPNGERDSNVIRILGIDPTTGTPVAEYVYLLQAPEVGNSKVDSIRDAVFAGDGKFFVIESDSSLEKDAQKFVFDIDIKGATNVLGKDFGELTLEQQTPDSLAALGIRPVNKTKVANLPSLGYSAGQPAGLSLLPDGRLAVLNDNAFGLKANDTDVQLGIIDFAGSNGLDASDKDGKINIAKWPVFGMYMPDAIASFKSGGETYYLIANEGEDRGDANEDERGDAIRLEDLSEVSSFDRDGLKLDKKFDAAIKQGLLKEENLGRLKISSIDGDTNGDGKIDQLISYGGRSFSVIDSNGNIVFDSGDQIAQITAKAAPELFNADDGKTDEVEARSGSKGAEPEAVAVGVIGGKPFGFIGLERSGGGVLVYDLSNPREPEFIQYIRSDEDIAPEGFTFISAKDSPNGQPLLSVTNEVSNTVAIYGIDIPKATASEIQGRGRVSPLEGELVKTEGVVTNIARNGFYLQGERDGIFVDTGNRPDVEYGDRARVFGTVSEKRVSAHHSVTSLTSPDVVVLNDLTDRDVSPANSLAQLTDQAAASDYAALAVQPMMEHHRFSGTQSTSFVGALSDDNVIKGTREGENLRGSDLLLGNMDTDLLSDGISSDMLTTSCFSGGCSNHSFVTGEDPHLPTDFEADTALTKPNDTLSLGQTMLLANQMSLSDETLSALTGIAPHTLTTSHVVAM